MAQARPEEFKLYRLNLPRRGEAEESDFERRKFANVIALLAIAALVLLGYWVFHALDHSRELSDASIWAATIAWASSIPRSELRAGR